jgi:hypothetical protein
MRHCNFFYILKVNSNDQFTCVTDNFKTTNMGLDMRPMGKPKPGFKKKVCRIFEMVSQDKIPQPSLFDKLKGKKLPSKDELLQEWFAGQIQTHETINAPRVAVTKKLTIG